jgi:protein-S-isoprenylcysteine O-methyltransferase Ste14
MNIGAVQKIRKIGLSVAILTGVVLAAVTESSAPYTGKIHELIEWIGIVLIVVCIVGRTWSSLYIAGRKNSDLITTGPYSISRNPLYFFSIIGATGMGMQMGSFAVGLAWGLIALVTFYYVTLQEEKLLLHLHGSRYLDYSARVPRMVPHIFIWADNPTLTIRPNIVIRTFADALLFVLAIPIAELIEALQNANYLPVLFVLP